MKPLLIHLSLVIRNPETEEYILVMESAERGNLYGLLENDKLSLCVQVKMALETAKGLQRAHRLVSKPDSVTSGLWPIMCQKIQEMFFGRRL